MGALDDRVVGEHTVHVEQRIRIEKPRDRVAPRESIRGAHRPGELEPAFGELGAHPRARAPGRIGPAARRLQAFVEAADLAPDPGCQPFVPGQRLRVDVLLAVCRGELARGGFEAGPHGLEVLAGFRVRLSECAGAAGEKGGGKPHVHESEEEPRTLCPDRMLGHGVIVVRGPARCQTRIRPPGSAVAGGWPSR